MQVKTVIELISPHVVFYFLSSQQVDFYFIFFTAGSVPCVGGAKGRVKYFSKRSKKGFMSELYELEHLSQVVFRAWEEHQMGVSITVWRRGVMAKLNELKHRTPNRTNEHLFCAYDVRKTFKQIDIFINNTYSK